MATLGRSAPLQPESTALVADPGFQELLDRCRVLVQKILLSIPETHNSCIHIKTLQLNSPDNAKLELMAASIGIPRPPVLRVVSENFTLNTSLKHMSEGLQLHRALLSVVSERLQDNGRVIDLMADVRDLNIQINKLQKMVHRDATVQPTSGPVPLRLHGDYEVQVAAHLTLVQLQSFGQDTARCLRSLDCSDDNDEEMQS